MLSRLPKIPKKWWLLVLSLVLVSAGGIFFYIKWRKGHKFDLSTAYAVELPKGITQKDLSHLTSEQKTQIDQEIKAVLTTKVGIGKVTEEKQTPIVIVLTQNGQPILPDLENKNTGGGRRGPAESSTDQVVPQVSPTPYVPAVTSGLSPTIASREGGASPTPEPCTDTDPTQYIYEKGTCTDKEKTYEDVCTPDLISLDQYYCDKWGTLLCKSQRTNCTYDCRDGKCLTPFDEPNPTWTPTPTRTPTPTLKPSPTPTTIVYPCIDSDGGKDLYHYGVVSWRGETWKDNCYSTETGKDVYSCSGSSCRLFENYCENNLPVREIFPCANGCKDGACLQSGPTATPTKVVTATPTKVPSAQPTPTLIVLPTLTPTPTAVATPTPAQQRENLVIFRIDQEVEEKYHDKTGRSLLDDLGQVKAEVKKIFGPPFANIYVDVKYGQGSGNNLYSYYNASTNEMILSDYDFNFLLLTQKTVLAFQDDLYPYMPQNWELAIWNLISSNVTKELDPNAGNLGFWPCPLCELNGSSPAWATMYGDSWSPSPVLNSHFLTLTTLNKIYIEDPQFFVKFNEALYKQPADWGLKGKIPSIAGSVKPTVEGIPFDDWISYHPVLLIGHVPGKYVMPFIEPNGDKNEMIIKMKAVEVLQDGTKKGVDGLTFHINALTHDNFQVWSNQGTTSGGGDVDLWKMPKAGGASSPGFPQTYTGAMRFTVNTSGFGSYEFYYPYKDGKPFIPGVDPHPGIFGVVINRTSGYLRFKVPTMEFDNLFINGMFRTKTGFPEDPFYQIRGSVEIGYLEPDRNYPQGESGSVKKIITKDTGDYYTTFRMVGAASSTRGAPEASSSAECAKDWQEYKNEKLGFQFKISTGWTDDTIEERQSEDFAQRRLVSTLNPAEQIDPKYKISIFEVLASKKDFKTDEDYGRWFEDNTGNQKKSTVDFKGISAEKYVDETEMVCSSQTEEKSTSCSHRFEMYYFKKGDVYYVLRVSIYTSPDLKEKNEKNLQCFLESFGFIGEESKEGKNGELIKCSPELLNTQKGLLEQQEEWWTKPGPCDKEKEDPVCGHTRSVYDAGKEEISQQTNKNVCEYCKFFDENGFRELRGTKSYSLGYTKGACK